MITPIINKFNRGEIDPLAMTRDDVTKLQGSQESIINFLPMRLGPATFRPAFIQLQELPFGGCRMESFVPSTSNPFIILMCEDGNIRVATRNPILITNELDSVITRLVGTGLTVNNGTFDTDISWWTDASDIGGSTSWDTDSGLVVTGSKTTSGRIYQTVTAGTGDNVVRIVVEQAPITLSMGTDGVDSDDIYKGTLLVGTHSLLVDSVPSGDTFTITFTNSNNYDSIVRSVTGESSGILTLPMLDEGIDLSTVRIAHSADVMYCSVRDGRMFRVEKRGNKSWSVTEYRANDGPFRSVNNTDTTLTAGSLSGDTTLTASANLFRETHVGALFKLVSQGQNVESDLSAGSTGTNSIKVTGVDSARKFTIIRAGTWSGTVTLQRSADDVNWENIATYTGNGTTTYDDNLNNSQLFYRLYVESGDYTSGTIELSISYSAGSITGVARVTAFTSATEVNVQVIEDFGSVVATRDWYEGEWSDRRGFPSATDLYEGRLWFAGKTKLWGSSSDNYSSYDSSEEGDGSAIFRTIGFGPVDYVNWLKGTNRLLMGLDSDSVEVRSSSFGDVLTNDTTNLKSGSTQGAAPITPTKIDDRLMYVQSSRRKILNLQYAVDKDLHIADDLMTLNPNICDSGIIRIVTLRQPETRVIVLTENGDLRVYLYDPAEQVGGWSRIETDMNIQDIVMLPADGYEYLEDQLFAIVSHNNVTRLTRLAMFDQTFTYHYDLCRNSVNYDEAGLLTGLDDLIGDEVSVWDQVNQVKLGDYTVDDNGEITSPDIEQDVQYTVGMPYVASIKSGKLSRYVSDQVLGMNKRIVNTGLIMTKHIAGTIRIGDSENNMYPMPSIEYGKEVVSGTIIDDYKEIPFEFDSDTDPDPRIHINASAPCTILALTYGVLDLDSSYGEGE